MRVYLILSLILLLYSSPSYALDIFGFSFFENSKNAQSASGLIDPKMYRVTFKISGRQTQVEDEIDKNLKDASQLWTGREKPVSGNTGIISRARADYKRLLASLYKAGYYGPSISIKISGKEAASLSPIDDLDNNPMILISIDPGPVYHFGTLIVENASLPPFKEVENQEIFQKMPFETGAIARADTIRLKKASLVSKWRAHGYAKARISDQKIIANHEERQITVSLIVTPGPKTKLGKISVKGNKRTKRPFILRQAGFETGKVYDLKDFEKAEKRLNRLEVFSTRKIEEAENLVEGNQLPVVIHVQERKPRSVGFGAIISNVDGAGIQTFLLHRNLFGHAEKIRISGEISGLGQTSNLTELDYNFNTEFKRPGVFHPDFDFNSRFNAKREFNDTFEETSIENETGFSYLKSDALTFGFGARLQAGAFDDSFGTRDLLTVGLFADAVFDKRDNKFEPKKGFYIDADINPFYEFEFANQGVQFNLEGRTYKTFDKENRFTLASRGRLGVLIGPEREETASNLLYFTGGGGSVRGFGFKTIGVLEDDGTVSGGLSFLEASLEGRFRVNETFGGILFIDAGAVSDGSFFSFEDEARLGAGLGIRYYTSLGPIRLDLGVPLNGGDDDPPVAIYAGIGQSF